MYIPLGAVTFSRSLSGILSSYKSAASNPHMRHWVRSMIFFSTIHPSHTIGLYMYTYKERESQFYSIRPFSGKVRHSFGRYIPPLLYTLMGEVLLLVWPHFNLKNLPLCGICRIYDHHTGAFHSLMGKLLTRDCRYGLTDFQPSQKSKNKTFSYYLSLGVYVIQGIVCILRIVFEVVGQEKLNKLYTIIWWAYSPILYVLEGHTAKECIDQFW
jgi:hypothetical protein